MSRSDLAGLTWSKSSRSEGNGQCVEVARADGVVALRDSKQRDGCVICVPSEGWQAFIRSATAMNPDLP
ncbi:DUF397 domain-containing protein [Streptomyces sp. NPDC049881]|uniref:DUF397 domain-containing protein n=1 Tax=Streptomyces sp. NPDC049881 TaxID=3155778 RepID=UPI00341A62AD